MNPVRKRKLKRLIFFLSGCALVITFTLLALKENINVFYTPTDLQQANVVHSKTVRLGGMVKKGSVIRNSKDLKVRFEITDFKESILVSYEGILPDLFREGQGVIVLGQKDGRNTFNAKEVLAKHDENYMPPELKDKIPQISERKNVS